MFFYDNGDDNANCDVGNVDDDHDNDDDDDDDYDDDNDTFCLTGMVSKSSSKMAEEREIRV